MKGLVSVTGMLKSIQETPSLNIVTKRSFQNSLPSKIFLAHRYLKRQLFLFRSSDQTESYIVEAFHITCNFCNFSSVCCSVYVTTTEVRPILIKKSSWLFYRLHVFNLFAFTFTSVDIIIVPSLLHIILSLC